MKNYRMLITLGIVILMLASIYSMVMGAAEEEQAFQDMVAEAREYKEQKLWKKASDKYLEVIDARNEIQYYVEVIDMYYEAGLTDACFSWCEEVLEVFPEQSVAYECILRSCIDEEEYEDAFSYLDQADGRGVTSAKIEEYRAKIKFTFELKRAPGDELRTISVGCAAFRKGERWGLCSAKGATLNAAQHLEVSYFANDVVAVKASDENWYFMNKSGDFMHNISLNIPGQITEVGLYNEGLFPVCSDGVYDYYDLSFQKKFGGYDYAGAFNNGVAAVKSGNVWHLIDTTGAPLNTETYADVVLDNRGICCTSERIFAKQNNAYIMLDRTAQRVGSETFENAAIFAAPYGAVCKNGLWGFVDANCNYVITPQYLEAKSFGCGLGTVKTSEGWGFVDETNTMQIKPEYVECTTMSSAGTSFVYTNGDWKILTLFRLNH